MPALVQPHGGGSILPLLLEDIALEEEKLHAKTLPQIVISSREAGDIIMMGIGGFTPLEGFMSYADWKGVCDDFELANGLFWPIPITLSVDKSMADTIKVGNEIALLNPHTQDILATMSVTEKYGIDKDHECNSIYQTTELDHPGVKMVLEQGDVNLAGPIKVLSTGGFKKAYGNQFLTPLEARTLFTSKGWKKVAAFQTRNPMHRAHEYLVKIAIETLDGVLIHSLLGQLRPGDIPAEVRSKSIQVLIDNYFVKNTVVQAGFPLDMRYAGPREALLHALFRQNYGCSHLIVGRDHAGVEDYYGPFDAQKIFDEIPKGALETQPLKFDWSFWCNKCNSMASMKTCPHEGKEHLLLSGTRVRKALSENLTIPENYSRPEVLQILREYYDSLN